MSVKNLPGHFSGMKFPHTAEQLKSFGPSWYTALQMQSRKFSWNGFCLGCFSQVRLCAWFVAFSLGEKSCYYYFSFFDVQENAPSFFSKDAFHKFGTLSEDNYVTKVVHVEQLPHSGFDAAGGAGHKAFIELQYAKPDPNLHTLLFAKHLEKRKKLIGR